MLKLRADALGSSQIRAEGQVELSNALGTFFTIFKKYKFIYYHAFGVGDTASVSKYWRKAFYCKSFAEIEGSVVSAGRCWRKHYLHACSSELTQVVKVRERRVRGRETQTEIPERPRPGTAEPDTDRCYRCSLWVFILVTSVDLCWPPGGTTTAQLQSWFIYGLFGVWIIIIMSHSPVWRV